MRYLFLKSVSVLVVNSLLFVGCATRTVPVTVEGKIAQNGRRVIAAAENVLNGVDSMVTTGALSKEDATRVVLVIKRVGEEGQRLATILQEVDSSSDELVRSKGFVAATQSLNLIQRLVIEAGAGIGSSGSRQKIIDLLAQITEAVTGIAVLFPTPVPVK